MSKARTAIRICLADRRFGVFAQGRCQRLDGALFAQRDRMADTSLEERSVEEQFRGQADLIDRLLIYRFAELDKRWDAKLDAKLEGKLKPMRNDMALVKEAVKNILRRLR